MNDKATLDRKKCVGKIRDLEKQKVEINKQIKNLKNELTSLDNYLLMESE